MLVHFENGKYNIETTFMCCRLLGLIDSDCDGNGKDNLHVYNFGFVLLFQI